MAATWEPHLDPHDMKWTKAAVTARDKLEMPPEITPWMDTNPKLTGVPPHERFPTLLDIAYYAFLKKEQKGKASRAANGAPKWFVDLSQGPDRGHWGTVPPCMDQNTAIYSFENDIVFLEGWGHRMLGFPNADVSGLSKCAIKSLVGEAIDLPSQAIILYAIFLTPTAPWWRKDSATDSVKDSAATRVVDVATSFGPALKRRKLPTTFDLTL